MTDLERLNRLQYKIATETQCNGSIQIQMPEFFSDNNEIRMWIQVCTEENFTHMDWCGGTTITECINKWERNVNRFIRRTKRAN